MKYYIRDQDHISILENIEVYKHTTISGLIILPCFLSDKIKNGINNNDGCLTVYNDPCIIIKNVREKYGISISTLAEITKLTYDQIKDIENVKTRSLMNNIIKICIYLNINPITFGF